MSGVSNINIIRSVRCNIVILQLVFTVSSQVRDDCKLLFCAMFLTRGNYTEGGRETVEREQDYF